MVNLANSNATRIVSDENVYTKMFMRACWKTIVPKRHFTRVFWVYYLFFEKYTLFRLHDAMAETRCRYTLISRN